MDHSACDRDWAKNIGIEFYTPEQFFWEKQDEVRQPAQQLNAGTTNGSSSSPRQGGNTLQATAKIGSVTGPQAVKLD